MDVGSSSVRAALYDFDANMLPQTFVKRERVLSATSGGGAVITAEEALEQVVGAVDDVLKRSAPIQGEIEYAASCSFWHSLVGVDAKGKPTTKVFGWADRQSRKYTAELRRIFDEPEAHDRTGARFHSSFWPAKLLWLRKEYPETFARTEKWLSLSDYVALKLFGSSVTSVSMASATGIFDIRKCKWDKKLLKFLKITPENLPEIVGDDSQTFDLNARYAKRWPRLKTAKWFPAIGDGAANNIGAGCVTKSKAAIMIGTSGAMRVAYRGEPPEKIPPGLWCYRIDRGRLIVGGALSDGGGLYRWLKDSLVVEDNVEGEIAKREPDSHGLTFLPFVAGERSTGYNEDAAGAIIGVRSATTPADIIHAAFESVAYRFADIFDQLETIVKPREIVASGGALRESPVWTQIIANVLGKDLSLPDAREASSRGAVLLVLETIGKIKNIEQISAGAMRTFSYAKAFHAVYRKARKQHDRYYLMNEKVIAGERD